MSTLQLNGIVIGLQMLIHRQLANYKVPEMRSDILRQLACRLAEEADQLADPSDDYDTPRRSED